MNIKFTIFSIVLISTFLTSCKTLHKSNIVPQSKTESIIKTNIEISRGPYHPSKSRKFDLLHTKLEVNFDWVKQYMNGIATLRLKPYFFEQDILELDAKGMDILKLEMVAPKTQLLKYSYDKKNIRIQLDKKYSKNDTITISINYVAKPNELPKGGSAAITEDKGLYFINSDGADKSKPRQIWTQGETEASSCWFPTIDATNERCTQEMYITTDTIFEILSNGERIYTKRNPNGTKTDYWKMELPHAPYLFMMAIGDFSIVEDTMKSGKYDFKDLSLKYYVEPKFKPYAKNIFGNTPEMILFFSELLNYKYPWSKYSQVVVRDYVSGAMENTSAVVFMEALQVDDRELLDENWDGIIAHELFHHWFGDLVTCESWANLPLNESFANYAEYLWTEHKSGIDEADLLAEKEKGEYYDEAKRKQEPLIRYHYKDNEDMFDRHSYNKGGRVLHMLRKYVGDEAFFSSLNLYLKKHQFESVEIHDLRLAFEEITGEDLNWFFNQWFLHPGHANLKIEHDFDTRGLKILVKQLQDTTTTPIYRIPLPIEIWSNGTKSEHVILIDKTEQEFLLPALSNPQAVIVDPEHQLLGNIIHSQLNEELVFQFKNSERYLNRLEALKVLFDFDKKELKGKENPKFFDSKIKELLVIGLKDPFWSIRDFCLDQLYTYIMPDFDYYLPLIEEIAIKDSKPSVRAKAITLLASYNSKAYLEIFEIGLKEKAYSIVGASLTGYLKSASPDAAAAKLKSLEEIDNIHIILPLAEYYLESKNNTKYQWFKKNMNTGNAQKLYNLMNFFGYYLNIVSSTEKEDGKKILQKIAKDNKYEVIRQTAQGFLEAIK